jgi:hypothetical protein
MPMSEPISSKPSFQDVQVVCEVFERAAEHNLEHPHRTGSLIDLPDEGHMLVAGDLHDHRVNFEKIVRLANLANKPGNQLVLQELIHGEKLVNGLDLSYRTSAQAAAMQIAFPNRVHVLLSNHELAQINGEEISKHGVSSIEAFHAGLEYVFGDEAERVHEAFAAWVRSLPLAVRTDTGLLIAHSLPATRKRETFDPAVLSRPLTDDDLAAPNGSAHLMVWGRTFGQAWVDDLATLWDVGLFVLGHQHADMGYELLGETVMVLASDHEHGVALPINLVQPYTRTQLTDAILPLAALPARQ